MTAIAIGCLIIVFAYAATALTGTLIRIAEGIERMADLEAQAIADLNAGVDAVVVALNKLAADLAAAQAAAGTPPVDHSAEIEGAVKKLADAVAAVSAPAPAAPSA